MITHAIFIETNIMDYRDNPERMKDFGLLSVIAHQHHYFDSKALSDYWLIHRLVYIYDSGIFIYFPWIPFYYNYKVLFPYLVTYSNIWLLQGAIHEWYHLNDKERKEHFNFFLNNLLSFLSVIGITNVKKHQKHHMHSLHNLEAVVDFDDMRFPIYTEFMELVWKILVKIKIKTNMNVKTKFLLFNSIALHFIMAISAIYIINSNLPILEKF